MDSFRNKFIPTNVNKSRGLESQEEFCNNSVCEENPEIDCGNCLFSERFCKLEIFEDWKQNQLNNITENEQD